MLKNTACVGLPRLSSVSSVVMHSSPLIRTRFTSKQFFKHFMSKTHVAVNSKTSRLQLADDNAQNGAKRGTQLVDPIFDALNPLEVDSFC